MNPIGTPLALGTGMQPLPIPASASSSATSAPREDVVTATRRDEGFAQRLQERTPRERTSASGSNRAERSAPSERAEKRERPPQAADSSAKASRTKSAAEVENTAPTDAPTEVSAQVLPAPVDDQHVTIDMPAIAPGSVIAEALLALVGTTSAAIDPTQATAPDQDPLLAALATLLGELPDAQAMPTTQAGPLTAPMTEDTSAMVPSLLALLGAPPASDQASLVDAEGANPMALLTGAAAVAITGNHAGTGASSTISPTDASLAADAMAKPTTSMTAGMQAATDDAGGQAAQQSAAPVLPTATGTATTDEEVPFTIAEPRAAGETTAAKPAAAPVTRPAPEAGNPMERAVANQVSRALIRESADGSRMISLRLTPPELGTVRIDIVERAGVMTARLHAEDAGVRVALERYLPQLRQDLLSHNAPVRELQLADAWAGDLTRQNHGDQQGRTSNRRGGRSAFSLDGVAAVPVAATAAKTTSTITADSVDARA